MTDGEGYVGSRTVQVRGGSITVCIPSDIADRYGIEKGDQLFWVDDPDTGHSRVSTADQLEALEFERLEEPSGELLCEVQMSQDVLPDTSDLSELARIAHGYGDALEAFEESGL